MKTFLFLVLVSSLNLNAYCISNNTQQNILFMVEFYPNDTDSILSFKKNIKATETLCCDIADKYCNPLEENDSKISFYAFLNEDSIEGCDIFGTVNSHVVLKTYEVFDNCIWE